MAMDFNKALEDEVLKFLQHEWNQIGRFDERGLDIDKYVERFMACEKMGEYLTGKKIEVSPDNKVYTFEDVVQY